jgi:surface protein
MFIGMGFPIPDLSNLPGPSRPGHFIPTDAASYEFKFEVSAGQVGITVIPNINGIGFTIEWQDGTTQAITSGQTNLQSPTTQAGIISINKETDTGFCDDFAVIDGKEFVTKVISWGQNTWNRLDSAFLNCVNLTDIGRTSLKTDGILGDFDYLFKGCSSLTAIDMTNWDLSSGGGVSIRSIAQDCVNLEQVDLPSNKKITFRTVSDSAFRNVGTSTTNGCIFNMQGLDSSGTTTANGYNSSSWFYLSKMSPSSNFSNWVFNSSLAFNMSSFFREAEMTGTNSTLDFSGWSSLKSTSFSSVLRGFNSNGTSPNPDSNFTINLSNLNLSHATYLGYFMGFSSNPNNVRNIIGLSTLPAMVAAATSTTNFISGCYFLKLTAADNLSDAFMNSLNSTDSSTMFGGLGRNLAFGDYGKAPNLAGLNFSSSTSLAALLKDTKFTDVPDFSNVTFPTAAVTYSGIVMQMDISDTNAHLVIDNPTFKPLSLSNAFREVFASKITIGDSVDLSSCITFQNGFYQAGSVSRPVEVTLPTTADYSGITASTALNSIFAGLNSPLGGTQVLSTCVGDTLIRRLFATTLNNNPQPLNLYNTKTTGSPSVVSSHITDLTAAGWTITDNTTDAVMPFVYATPLITGTPNTPTGSFTGGTFSSSDAANIPVDVTTGVINTTNAGNTTIRYTLADGCYNEQAISLVSDQIDNVYSMAFDGVNDYIDAGTGVGNALGSSATNFSVSGWFKTVVNPLPSGEGMFSIGLGPVNAATTSPFEFFQDYYQVLYVRSGVSRVGFSFDVRPEAWRHYCVVYDGTKAVATDRFNLYINGVAPTKINLFGTIPTSINLTNQSAFIGGVSANKYYNGSMDEVAVFNYSLTGSEALNIYNATSVVDGVVKTKDLSLLTTPPIAWYRMGD